MAQGSLEWNFEAWQSVPLIRRNESAPLAAITKVTINVDMVPEQWSTDIYTEGMRAAKLNLVGIAPCV
jgi:hypothetical protein